MKPLKFAPSFAVFFGTIALIEPRLSDGARAGWTLRVLCLVMAAALQSEMAYMMYQAGRSEPSHVNMPTPLHRIMYERVMAAGAVALVAGTAVVGRGVRRDKGANPSAALREAIRLGFLLTFVMTMITAGYLGLNGGAFRRHLSRGAPTIPIFGWPGVTGGLRPTHFASLHAMQTSPAG